MGEPSKQSHPVARVSVAAASWVPAGAAIAVSLVMFAIQPGFSALMVVASLALITVGLPASFGGAMWVKRQSSKRVLSVRATRKRLGVVHCAVWVISWLAIPLVYPLFDALLFMLLTTGLGVQTNAREAAPIEFNMAYVSNFLAVGALPAIVALAAALALLRWSVTTSPTSAK